MKRVLVTGASGFIGRHSIGPLLERGFDVHCTTTRTRATETPPRAVWHRADLLNAKESREIFRDVRPTHMLHFAWFAEPGEYWTSPKNLDWEKASLSMLADFKDFGGKRAVFAGTCAEYDWDAGSFSESTTPTRPRTLYGACKNSLRQNAESFCGPNGISFAWGRIFFVYGPDERPSRLVSSFIRSLLAGEEARCTSGTAVRDFLCSEDVASAFVSLLDGGVEGAVNIASGKPISIRDLVTEIGRRLGRPDLIRLGAVAAATDEPPVLVADTRRLTEEVGWRPKYGLDEGLDRTIAWWKENRGPKP